MTNKIRVYCAISLDGFLAGEADELDWLGEPDPNIQGEPGTIDFTSFLAETGAMLMGRRTFDVVWGFDGPWPYGELPVLVATNRALDPPLPTVRPVKGDMVSLCAEARVVAGDKHVTLDGGALITQALDANLVDEMVLTIVPVLLGRGIRLYQGSERHHVRMERVVRFGDMVQVFMARPG
jgi:dihydrofolate reductase